MTAVSHDDLRQLRQEATSPCISLFMPTHRGGAEVQQDPIRLRNLLRQAEEQLEERGVDRGRWEEVLAAGRSLLDDNAFWQRQGDGLALFLAPGLVRDFRLSTPLPERVYVGDRIHLSPLLPLINNDGRFHILALSQKRVRVFEATRDSVRELELADVPRSVQEALNYDENERELQFHSAPATPQTNASRGRPSAAGQNVHTGRSKAMFHGHGGADDDSKEQVLRFVQVLDDALARHLRKQQPVPLVLAAVDYEQAMYRASSKHPQLVAEGIEGNPDLLSGDELRQRALPLVEPLLRADQERAAAAFEELGGTERVSRDLEEVLKAATDGRVDTLFVDVSRPRWGRFDEGNRTVEVHDQRQPQDEDLIDRAASEALARGGSVFAVDGSELPGGGEVAAVFRY